MGRKVNERPSDLTAEERWADTIESRAAPVVQGLPVLVDALNTVGGWDRGFYCSVGRLPTPFLDAPLREFSRFANFSKPWLLVTAAVALTGGERGRRAAVMGLAAVAATSFVVNQPMKLIGDRTRPDREALGVPKSRWVKMPATRSFPSGHSASAAAFAVVMGQQLPRLRLPLGLAAGVVAFSRVYTGVHYPGDVVGGVVAGSLVGRVTLSTFHRRHQVTA